MARIYPFKALRYDPNKVNMQDVVTQPYDKITPQMQQAYYDRSKYNLIRVILGKKEPGDTDAFAPLPEGEQAHNVYTRAAESLTSWRKKAILREETEPALYGYSQTYTVPGTSAAADGKPEVRTRRGFIALGHLYDYADQVIYRHEQTFPKHKSDRLALFKATRAYCEQIYMLYSDPAFTAETLIFGEETDHPRPADLVITDEYAVVHRVWRLTDPHLINLIVTAMQDKKLIIADGHHRYETSVTYMHERAQELGLETSSPRENAVILSEGRSPQSKDPDAASLADKAQNVSATGPGAPGLDSQTWASTSHNSQSQAEESPSNRADEPHTLLPQPPFPESAMMMTFVNMEAPGITILPTHRVLFNLDPETLAAFIPEARAFFDITELDTPDTSQLLPDRVSFIAVTKEKSYLLAAKEEPIQIILKALDAGITDRQSKLDVVQLHRIVLEHLLRLTHESIANTENIRYLRDAAEAIQQVADNKADVAFLIRPVTLQQMRDISLSNEVMPQKSTDFYPKLLSGLAIYALD